MKLVNLSSKLIAAALPVIMMSCGTPHDRDAVVSPKVEGRLITLKNVEDITKNSSPKLYSKTATAQTTLPTPAPGTTSTTTTAPVKPVTNALDGDVQKLVALVASADPKNYLERHLNAGGKIGFAFHSDHVRIYAQTTKDVVSKIASGPADLTITDIRKAKTNKIDKKAYIKMSREESNPVSAERYLEVAAVEIEKSGVLESEKTDYNETKPLLTIVNNLPIEVSTHVILKQEIVLSGSDFKKLSEDSKAEPSTAATPEVKK